MFAKKKGRGTGPIEGEGRSLLRGPTRQGGSGTEAP